MKITAMVDTSDLRDRLNLYSQVVGKEIGESLRQHARVACVALANTTQPYTGSGEDGASKAKEGKRIGEQSILNDVSKVFYTANEPTRGYENSLKQKVDQSRRTEKGKAAMKARIEKYCRSNDSEGIAWLARFFKTERVQLDTFDKQLYNNARTGRRTNVPKKTKMLALVIGADGELTKFKEERMRTAGMGKAGWAACAEKIPLDQTQSATRGIPQWVTRHKGRSVVANSSISDLSNIPDNPKVVMNNAVPWVSNLLSDSQAKAALEIARNKFVKYMQIAITKTLRDQVKLKAA
jgi:hypothetical protein